MQLSLVAIFSLCIAYAACSANSPVCIDGFTLANNKCLKLFTNETTYKLAEQSCKFYGATLVTPKNINENRAITTFLGSSASLVWMGLYCFDSDPMKCLWDDASGSADSYNSFASGFPLIDIGKCVYYSSQGALAGKWLSGDCEKETRAYVCELPSTHADSCQFNYNGHCYTIYSSATFVQAQSICEQECGNLASITSANENRYIQTLTNNLALTSYLIGGMWPSQNVFNWIDGSTTSYNNIDKTVAYNANCMAVSNSADRSIPPGYWYSASCSTSYNFICKRPAGVKCSGTPPPVTITPVPSNPSLCNSTLLFAPGVITSPNFPQNYANNQFCSYHLATLGSYNILLHFSSFYTENCCDPVSVYDGDSTSSRLMGVYKGQLSPFNLVSTGNTMFVTFLSDSSNVFQGFSAKFTSYTPYSG